MESYGADERFKTDLHNAHDSTFNHELYGTFSFNVLRNYSVVT
jgi:hypothetical protein